MILIKKLYFILIFNVGNKRLYHSIRTCYIFGENPVTNHNRTEGYEKAIRVMPDHVTFCLMSDESVNC